MKIVAQAARLVALVSAVAIAGAGASTASSMRKVGPVYEHGQQLAPANAPSPLTATPNASPTVAAVSPTTTPRSSSTRQPSYQYELLLTADTTDVRVVHFNEATCVSLDSCLGGSVVNATWTNDLGSPSDYVVTFFSDRECRKPITTQLPSPYSLDFSAKGEGISPLSFSVGEWFIHFDYPSHLVAPCVADSNPHSL